jgi:hypothetical protein
MIGYIIFVRLFVFSGLAFYVHSVGGKRMLRTHSRAAGGEGGSATTSEKDVSFSKRKIIH